MFVLCLFNLLFFNIIEDRLFINLICLFVLAIITCASAVYFTQYAGIANTEKAKEKAKDHANRSQRFNSKVNKAKSKGKVLGGSNKIVTNNKVSDNNRDNSEQQVCDSMSAESIGF